MGLSLGFAGLVSTKNGSRREAGSKRGPPSNAGSTTSLVQGMTFRARPSMVFDIAVSQVGVGSGNMDIRLAAGLTVNLGRIEDR